MRNLKKHLFLVVGVTVLCLGAFVTSSNAQRHRGSGFSISFSIGSPYRSYYPRYYAPRVYRTAPVYYTPAPVYYSNYGYYNPGYYNSGYYAPAYNSGYYAAPRRYRSRRSCNYYRRY